MYRTTGDFDDRPGACAHTVIREDPTLNIEAADELDRRFLDLVDYRLFVIDLAGGDDIPRKRSPGVIQSDLVAGDWHKRVAPLS